MILFEFDGLRRVLADRWKKRHWAHDSDSPSFLCWSLISRAGRRRADRDASSRVGFRDGRGTTFLEKGGGGGGCGGMKRLQYFRYVC